MFFDDLKEKFKEYVSDMSLENINGSQPFHNYDHVDGDDDCKYLNELDVSSEGRIIESPEDSKLEALGLREGKEFTYKTKEPFNGPLLVSIDGRDVAIDENIAKEIFVDVY